MMTRHVGDIALHSFGRWRAQSITQCQPVYRYWRENMPRLNAPLGWLTKRADSGMLQVRNPAPKYFGQRG